MTHTRTFGYQTLNLVLVHAFFTFLIWGSVTDFTGQMLAIQANSGGNELTLTNLTDKVFLELLFAPVAAVTFCFFLPRSREQLKQELSSVNILMFLILAMSLSVLLPLNMSLDGAEGLALCAGLGFLAGIMFWPTPALVLVLSLGASTFLFVGFVHGSFFAVLLGLIYANTLLFGVGVGIFARLLTRKLFIRS